MNKLQKILWSIFSGMICMLYRPTYAELAACWSQTTRIKVTNCNTSTLSSIIASYCRNKNGKLAASSALVASACWYAFNNINTTNTSIKNEMSNIYISTQHFFINDKVSEDLNVCDEHSYYLCDPATNPSTSYCCSGCPVITGVPTSELYATENGYRATPLLNGTTVDTTVYVNICSAKSPDGTDLGAKYFQVYKSITDCIRATTKQTTTDCRRENPGTSTTNTKGTYVCAEDLVFQN